LRIGKPLLLITTPIGLAIGLYEGWRLAGGLVFVMAAFIGLLGFAFLTIVLTIRREREQERKKNEEAVPGEKNSEN
jgi:predicted MFS family arabinose efflux permease